MDAAVVPIRHTTPTIALTTRLFNVFNPNDLSEDEMLMLRVVCLGRKHGKIDANQWIRCSS